MTYRIPYILNLHLVSAAMHRLARKGTRRRPAGLFRLAWPRRQRPGLLWLLAACRRPAFA